jgi:hypothetical protein
MVEIYFSGIIRHELKIAPTNRRQRLFEKLQQPSEKAHWLLSPHFRAESIR